ncbi:MAG TPA: hypothetical protein VF669_08925 [Tepidisphaeraceae bacterium]
MLFPTPVQYRKRHRVAKRGAPPAPPPPAPVSVARVAATELANAASWIFSRAIADPTGDVSGLVIGAQGAAAWERIDAITLRVFYENDVFMGDAWSNAEGAGGIVSSEGGELVSGEGVVE